MTPIKIKTEAKVEVGIQQIAVAIAAADNEEQAQFFRAFSEALRGFCGSDFQASVQMSWIFDQLTPVDRELFDMLKTEEVS